MKIKVFTLLFIFISFLALPTILSRICDDVDISMAYAVTEEEENHNNTISEIFKDFTSEEHNIDMYSFSLKQERIIEEFVSKHDNLSSQIFSPPPEIKLV